MPDIRRDEIGVWIGSSSFRIQLTPVLAYPSHPESLFVRVYATTGAGEFPGQPLHEEKRWGFRFEDIAVSDTRLECWRHHEYAAPAHAGFRKGFCLELEPDSIAAVRAWLPPLRRISRVTRAIAKEVERCLRRPKIDPLVGVAPTEN